MIELRMNIRSVKKEIAVRSLDLSKYIYSINRDKFNLLNEVCDIRDHFFGALNFRLLSFKRKEH